MEPNIAPNRLLTRATGPPADMKALDRQITPQIPIAAAKAAVVYIPTL
jgi:hypothetical protein